MDRELSYSLSGIHLNQFHDPEGQAIHPRVELCESCLLLRWRGGKARLDVGVA